MGLLFASVRAPEGRGDRGAQLANWGQRFVPAVQMQHVLLHCSIIKWLWHNVWRILTFQTMYKLNSPSKCFRALQEVMALLVLLEKGWVFLFTRGWRDGRSPRTHLCPNSSGFFLVKCFQCFVCHCLSRACLGLREPMGSPDLKGHR